MAEVRSPAEPSGPGKTWQHSSPFFFFWTFFLFSFRERVPLSLKMTHKTPWRQPLRDTRKLILWAKALLLTASGFQGQMLRFYPDTFMKSTAWKSWMRDLQHLINVPERKGGDSLQTGTRNGGNRTLQNYANTWPWGKGELATPLALPLSSWLGTEVDMCSLQHGYF